MTKLGSSQRSDGSLLSPICRPSSHNLLSVKLQTLNERIETTLRTGTMSLNRMVSVRSPYLMTVWQLYFPSTFARMILRPNARFCAPPYSFSATAGWLRPASATLPKRAASRIPRSISILLVNKSWRCTFSKPVMGGFGRAVLLPSLRRKTSRRSWTRTSANGSRCGMNTRRFWPSWPTVRMSSGRSRAHQCDGKP